MALEQYAVQLTPDERERLSQLIRSGKSSARIIARARILLKVAEGWNAPQVAAALDISKGTVYRAKRRYAEEGLARIHRSDRPGVTSVSLTPWMMGKGRRTGLARSQ